MKTTVAVCGIDGDDSHDGLKDEVRPSPRRRNLSSAAMQSRRSQTAIADLPHRGKPHRQEYRVDTRLQ
ncbi:MAG: hypothetical protein JNK76_09690 [Planctomycetales bacterium]|nr:hypothetical protein [Planctomycetales bacterium]MBN8629120.1 hypothetical protein [Planctomycetota bacterium]